MADHRTWPASLRIARGDTVMLMADLTRIAWRAKREGAPFTASDLLGAFRDAVGSEGSVLVPTYNFDLPDRAFFDVRSTPTMSGALGNAALAHPAFARTPHPLHSFAVAGAAREELTRSGEKSSFGPASPFAYLYRHLGVLVTLDLPVNNALTFGHFVEERERVAYRYDQAMRFHYTDTDGAASLREFTIFTKKLGHHMDFTPMETALERAGALQRGVVDGTKWIRIDLVAAYPVIAENLRVGGPDGVHQFRWHWWMRDQLKHLLLMLRGVVPPTAPDHVAGKP
ncbi:MAG: AAC(3) family N-acetyltransferase [Flavobacteriales bacterium]